MNTSTASAPNASATPLVPVLRTVLIADVVESSAFLQRLGDARAATLLQRLELHLRDLLAATHGQFIDKADGVLALFERPVHAVDFALRYQKLLADLGAEYGEPGLCARIGIHVGEVMTWANDPRAVAAGAKPIEVEGLAKPVAARLMALALPGQVLLSGMAQTLALRAIGELGDRGDRLKWLMHGRYRFKGVPAPMLVHEAGETGISPLRAPPSGQKVWREVPLWRRPPMLALEVVTAVGVVIASLYGTFKSEPAMAFYERDWVVVADLNNLTDETLLKDPLETALRVGLQQSPYVNLVSDLRIEQSLERMGRKLDVPIDREIGTEIAAREGARALVLPTLTEVGGRLQISLEVVDPRTKEIVYSESAIASGSRDLLPAMDDVLERMRSRFGESVASIDQHSEPLAEVTTSNIEALRAYSLGLQARADHRLADALALQRQAIALDPDFALAYAALAALQFTNGESDAALANIHEALARRDKLTVREKLYLDAIEGAFGPLEPMLARWKLLATMYPDEYRAYYNYAYFGYRRGLNQQQGLDYLTPALAQQNPARVSAHFLRGVLLLQLDHQEESLAAFAQAQALGLRGYKGTYAAAHASRRDFASAMRVIESQEGSGVPVKDQEHQLSLAAFEADQGRIGDAVKRLVMVRREAGLDGDLGLRFQGAELSLRNFAPDATFNADLTAYVLTLSKEFTSADDARRVDLAYVLLAGATLLARHGNAQGAEKAIRLTEPFVNSAGQPVLSAMLAVARAEHYLGNGDADAAVDALALGMESNRTNYQAHAVLMRALVAKGDIPRARREAAWLATHRGAAYGEYGLDYMLQGANVVESDLALLAAQKLAQSAGDASDAERNRQAFRAAWGDAADGAAATNRLEKLKL
jgi:putative peptide modification system cyclase